MAALIRIRTRIRTRTRSRTCIRIRIHTNTDTSTNTSAYMYVHVHVYVTCTVYVYGVRVGVPLRVRVRVRVHAHAHACIYIYIYSHPIITVAPSRHHIKYHNRRHHPIITIIVINTQGRTAGRAWLDAAMPPHPRPTAGSPTKRASSSESSNGDHPYHHEPHMLPAPLRPTATLTERYLT